MLKIRLQRIGRNKKPIFRIIVTEHTRSPKASYIELLGKYDLSRKPKVFELDEKKFAHWLSCGAQPSSTLARLLKGKGSKEMDRYIEPMPDRKAKGEEATVAAAPSGGEVTPAQTAPEAEKKA